MGVLRERRATLDSLGDWEHGVFSITMATSSGNPLGSLGGILWILLGNSTGTLRVAGCGFSEECSEFLQGALGGMAERTKATVLKTVGPLAGSRGFESHSLRRSMPTWRRTLGCEKSVSMTRTSHVECGQPIWRGGRAVEGARLLSE